MCISILAERLITLELFGEYIYIRFNGGLISVTEVYDLFFSVSADWKKPRLTCISPHFLLSDNRLCVISKGAPGTGGLYDEVYKRPIGFGLNFSPGDRLFSVKTYDLTNLKNPQIIEISGEVIRPTVVVPTDQKESPLTGEVMSECGTVFDLHLPALRANVIYVMRLVVEPVELLGLPQARNLDEAAHESIRPYFVQDAAVTCPKSCRFDYLRLLQKTKEELPDLSDPIGSIAAKISDRRLSIVRSKRARIVLAWPKGCDLYREECQGSITSMGSPKAVGENIFQEYYGGTEAFWEDDIWSLGYGIWRYLAERAKAEPKKKELITTALRVQHENCSLIVDKMAGKGIINLVDGNKDLYQACHVTEEKLNRGLEEIAMDPEVSDRFVWRGYRIIFAIKYAYLSDEDRRRLVWERKRPIVALWLAIISILLGVIALILALIK